MEDELDQAFAALVQELDAQYVSLPKVIRIRIEHWVRKLCEPQKLPHWKRNRNNYVHVLLSQVSLQRSRLEAPFDKLPPEGELPMLPTYMLSVFDSPNSSRARSPGGKRSAAQRRSPTRPKPTKGESSPRSPGDEGSRSEVESLHRVVDSLQEALSREQAVRSDLEIKLQDSQHASALAHQRIQELEELVEELQGQLKVVDEEGEEHESRTAPPAPGVPAGPREQGGEGEKGTGSVSQAAPEIVKVVEKEGQRSRGAPPPPPPPGPRSQQEGGSSSSASAGQEQPARENGGHPEAKDKVVPNPGQKQGEERKKKKEEEEEEEKEKQQEKEKVKEEQQPVGVVPRLPLGNTGASEKSSGAGAAPAGAAASAGSSSSSKAVNKGPSSGSPLVQVVGSGAPGEMVDSPRTSTLEDFTFDNGSLSSEEEGDESNALPDVGQDESTNLTDLLQDMSTTETDMTPRLGVDHHHPPGDLSDEEFLKYLDTFHARAEDMVAGRESNK